MKTHCKVVHNFSLVITIGTTDLMFFFVEQEPLICEEAAVFISDEDEDAVVTRGENNDDAVVTAGTSQQECSGFWSRLSLCGICSAGVCVGFSPGFPPTVSIYSPRTSRFGRLCVCVCVSSLDSWAFNRSRQQLKQNKQPVFLILYLFLQNSRALVDQSS